MAARAASFTSAGAGKSGNPCARLTALYCSARRVISRITDSVKYSAFSESINRAVLAMLSAVGLASAGLVIVIFGNVMEFTDAHPPARQMREPHRERHLKLWRAWRGRAGKSGGKARRCAPRSEHTRGSV